MQEEHHTQSRTVPGPCHGRLLRARSALPPSEDVKSRARKRRNPAQGSTMMAMAGLCTDSERMVVCANWAYEWGCSQMRPAVLTSALAPEHASAPEERRGPARFASGIRSVVELALPTRPIGTNSYPSPRRKDKKRRSQGPRATAYSGSSTPYLGEKPAATTGVAAPPWRAQMGTVHTIHSSHAAPRAAQRPGAAPALAAAACWPAACCLLRDRWPGTPHATERGRVGTAAACVGEPPERRKRWQHLQNGPQHKGKEEWGWAVKHQERRERRKQNSRYDCRRHYQERDPA